MSTVAGSVPARLLLSLLLIATVALSWSGIMERTADDRLQPTLQRALVTAALARGLNGVISVAQGTEIAISPVGVGVTIAAGEILDPLNDLIEQFSWLALAASASLGAQLLLTQIFAEPAVNMVLTGVVTIYLLVLWWPRPLPAFAWLLRAAAFLIFIRFLFTMITLSVGLVDHWVLQERQETALAELTMATEQIEQLEEVPAPALDSEPSILERFESALDSSRQELDIEAQISSLQSSVESSISQLIELIVVFVVQTLLLPLLAFYIAVGSFKWFWRWSLTSDPASNRRPHRN
jgi:hypothetical protein